MDKIEPIDVLGKLEVTEIVPPSKTVLEFIVPYESYDGVIALRNFITESLEMRKVAPSPSNIMIDKFAVDKVPRAASYRVRMTLHDYGSLRSEPEPEEEEVEGVIEELEKL